MKKLQWLLVVIMTVHMTAGCTLLKPTPKPVPEQQVASGVMVDGRNLGGMTRDEVNQVLEELAKERNQMPQKAFFDDEGRIQPERNGQMLNAIMTAERVMPAPADSVITAVYDIVEPVIREYQLAQATKIGAYSTPILDQSAGRLVNLKLTAKLVSNVVVEPGQEFSFNKTTGEPTVERGFQKAAIFGENGKKEEGLGGGMCQVSSTLYNAVMAAKLKVTERHAHSRPVAYVSPGRDATTFTDKDFRFVNTSRQSIVIRSFREGNQLIVDLWALPK